MLTMNTQFGDMVLTDDNKTLVNQQLANEINDKEVRGRRANMYIYDDCCGYAMDKQKE